MARPHGRRARPCLGGALLLPAAFIRAPRTIAAFGKECDKRGLYIGSVDVGGHRIPAWRGVPILPCGRIPVTGHHTSSIIATRTGEDNEGVIGILRTAPPTSTSPG